MSAFWLEMIIWYWFLIGVLIVGSFWRFLECWFLIGAGWLFLAGKLMFDWN